jgi:hypothetical protein
MTTESLTFFGKLFINSPLFAIINIVAAGRTKINALFYATFSGRDQQISQSYAKDSTELE